MNRSEDRARYESSLARAHRALYSAQAGAEVIGDLNAHDELWALQLRVQALLERSVDGKGFKRPIAQQTDILTELERNRRI